MNPKYAQSQSTHTVARLPRPIDRRGFEIGIICALVLEMEAVEALLDCIWDVRGQAYEKAPGDPNHYITGRIGHHNVVLVHMPRKGKAFAASSIASLHISFPNIRLALVVGICGAVPASPGRAEVILGDVMISEGVVQYDLGLPRHRQQAKAPDGDLRAAVARFQSDSGKNILLRGTAAHLRGLQARQHLRAAYPVGQDRLFQPAYEHPMQKMSCNECGCNGPIVLSSRLRRETSPLPSIHFGPIASGDTVMKSAIERDVIARRTGIIAFEMEGAGVLDVMCPSVVIKGAADYADSHKNNVWQRYAAATAAACAKAFLDGWHPAH